MEPKDLQNADELELLCCPQCGFHCLHHDKVEIFECEEDANSGVHVVVCDGRAVIDNSLAGNPSERRHGLRIHFWCEGCQVRSVLTIVQHKGSTFVKFNAETSASKNDR